MASPAEYIQGLVEKTNEYIETRVDLLKLKGVDRLSEIAGTILSSIALIFLVSLFLFIVSIGLSLYIGEAMGKMYLGFFIVGGFYMLLCILVFALRDKWLRKPFMNSLIDKIVN